MCRKTPSFLVIPEDLLEHQLKRALSSKRASTGSPSRPKSEQATATYMGLGKSWSDALTKMVTACGRGDSKVTRVIVAVASAMDADKTEPSFSFLVFERTSSGGMQVWRRVVPPESIWPLRRWLARALRQTCAAFLRAYYGITQSSEDQARLDW